MNEEVKVILATFVAMVMLIGALGVPLFFLKQWTCYQKWQDSYETNFSFGAGCRVKINGKWIPTSNVREF